MYNRIKQAFIKILQADDSLYPKTTASYKGREFATTRQSVYGVCSMPPKKSLGLLFQVEGNQGVQYGIFDYPTGRFKNLEEGEVQIGNYLTTASIKFDKDGNVTVNVPSGNLTASVTGNISATASGNLTADITGNTTINTTDLNITATGTSTINGGLTVTGDITANNFVSSGISKDFNSHVHGGVQSGGSNTDTPS
tara:strand:- start:1644 stop:2231 length:588 start_codon:yes stop_codon:yes gene_type:complete